MLEKKYLKRINKINWEFINADTTYLTHNFHRYSSKYIPQIAGNLIDIFSRENDLILDNFVGSGTTLVEAMIRKRRAIGIDINPLACLISKVKITPIEKTVLDKEIGKLIMSLKQAIYSVREQKTLYSFDKKNMIEEYEVPKFPYIDKWFQPQVIVELAIIKKYIDFIENKDARDMCLVAFSSIIRGVSNASSEFGNLMISKRKGKVTDTFERFVSKVNEIKSRILQLDKYKEFSKNIKVVCGDTRNLAFINDSEIDLIVTHPPYIAAVPYAEYQKLSLRWLGFSDRKLDKELIGGRRQSNDVVKRFDKDMLKAFEEMSRVLKDNKFCCIVIGNPTVKGKTIELNKKFIKFGSKVGLEFQYEIKRGKYNTTMGKMKEEFIMIFRKTN